MMKRTRKVQDEIITLRWLRRSAKHLNDGDWHKSKRALEHESK